MDKAAKHHCKVSLKDGTKYDGVITYYAPWIEEIDNKSRCYMFLFKTVEYISFSEDSVDSIDIREEAGYDDIMESLV